ncbi:MAG: cache domain-containing protein [Spongiibacteraceae bacterium]
MPAKRSMTQSYLLGLVTLATVPVMLLGYWWVNEQYRRFDVLSERWRSAYVDMQQQSLRRRVDDIVNSLDYARESLERRQREVLNRAVNNGIAQLDTFSKSNSIDKSNRSQEELRRRARDLLAPIRFGSGRDHYMIFSDDGTALLLPAYPQWEKRNVSELRDINGVNFIAKLMQQTRDNGEAYIEAWLPQTDGRSGALLTKHYVRYYAPLGVFLGATTYVEDMTGALQREELARLAKKAGAEEMVLRVSNSSDTVLLDTLQPTLQGKSTAPELSANSAMAEQLQKAFASSAGEFVTMQRVRRRGESPQPILVYGRDYPGWHWHLSAGYFMDPLESGLARQRAMLESDINRRIIEGAIVIGLCALIAIFVARHLALRTQRALKNFTRFFAEASRNATTIDVDQLPYSEFEELARDANAMVEQRNNIEQALRLSEQRFELALSASNSHLWDFNIQDKSVNIGGSLFKQLGYTAEARQIDFAELNEWIHPDDLAEVRRRPADEHQYTREFRVRARDGSYRWFLARGGEVDFDANGKALRALGTLIDVSARKQMEQELIAARISAEDASHAKSQFLSSISHELRTPLNGVLGYAQILLRDGSASAEQRHNLHAIESCGQHLLTLIDDVLDLAKIESGKIEIQENTCDLYDLLESVSNIVRERVDAKALSYELDISPQVPANILIDEVKLRQILVNLLANAVKFTEHGGVTLRVSLRDESMLQFQVQDTGIGIPPDRQRIIFEPFQQLGNAVMGTGLGLPISQRLCEAMGGALSVQSAIGTGSCFSFCVPLRSTTPASAERIARAGYQIIDTAGQHIEVMVVDDNPINRQVLSGMLRASGIEVCEAEHGQDALDKLREHPVPLVLMDVRMPVLDGFAATAAIKADPRLRSTIVIAVSASVFPDVIARMRAHGCADFVGKPVRVAELLSKVAEHLQLPLRELAQLSREEKKLTAVLPEAIRSELATAIALGDVEAMRATLQPLRDQSPQMSALAEHIEQLINNFDIDAVRELIAKARAPEKS